MVFVSYRDLSNYSAVFWEDRALLQYTASVSHAQEKEKLQQCCSLVLITCCRLCLVNSIGQGCIPDTQELVLESHGIQIRSRFFRRKIDSELRENATEARLESIINRFFF